MKTHLDRYSHRNILTYQDRNAGIIIAALGQKIDHALLALKEPVMEQGNEGFARGTAFFLHDLANSANPQQRRLREKRMENIFPFLPPSPYSIHLPSILTGVFYLMRENNTQYAYSNELMKLGHVREMWAGTRLLKNSGYLRWMPEGDNLIDKVVMPTDKLMKEVQSSLTNEISQARREVVTNRKPGLPLSERAYKLATALLT